MRWLLYLIIFILTIQQPCRGDLLEQVTYNSDPIPGTVRLHYNGWRGVVVREVRRQLFNMWLDTIELRSDGGLKLNRNCLIMEMQWCRGEQDLLGRYWERRYWELENPGPLRSLEIGGSPRSVDVGFVKLNPDWQVKWKEWGGDVSDFNLSWKCSPQVSLGLTGINSLGLQIIIRQQRSIEFSINGGWNRKRGWECYFAIEIWRI